MSFLSRTDTDSHLETLKNTLVDTIGDELGRYELIQKPTVLIPAIYVSPPELDQNQFRIKDNSGIECIISRSKEIKVDPMIGANRINLDYRIELVQHDLRKDTSIATMRVCNSRAFEVLKSPIVIPYMETPRGLSLERSIIKITVAYREELI
jgi:hypothetical protein